MEDDAASNILVVTAHPDDVDYGAAGTVARWTSGGRQVTYCLVTDGEAGGFDPSVSRRKMADIRRAEQTAAAKTVGVERLFFLGYPDGRVAVTIDLRRDLSRVIRTVRPDRVVCQSPVRNLDSVYASHPDHLAAGEAALCAVYPDARNQFAHEELAGKEGLEPWSVPEVWLMGGPTPDIFSDVTDHIETKVSALRCHVTQLTDPEATDGMIRRWGEAVGRQGGLPEGRLAESFRRLHTA